LLTGVGVFKIKGKLYQFTIEAPGHICHNGFNVEAHHPCRRNRDETEYSECKYKFNLRVVFWDVDPFSSVEIQHYRGTNRTPA
jgi:hypothetical protein